MTITLRPGTRPGFVEIAFPSKPSPADVAELKSSGFRYVPRGPHWYGRGISAPRAYAAGVCALQRHTGAACSCCAAAPDARDLDALARLN